MNHLGLLYQENRLTFSTGDGMRLIAHSDCSIKRHVKVRGDRSYFDGDVLYWSTRKGTHPDLPRRVAQLLKRYEGKCAECGHLFVGDDLIEVDHKIPKREGGTDQFDNLQPLHRHCHDVKTARDQANLSNSEQATDLERID
jgi:RNA-directed DNA polymerase